MATDTEYKEKVLEVKENVEKMFTKGQEKGFSMPEIEQDVDKYLKQNGLTSFDLRTDGDRKNGAYMQAMTHGFNTKLKEIIQVIAPEIASTFNIKNSPLFLGMDTYLENDKKLKENVSNMVENLFTMDIPGLGKITDKNFTPENLGERLADQAGESLMEFLPLMIAPNLIATSGPVQGLKQSITQDPTKLKKLTEVLGSSVNTILNQYIKNPGKAFIADISASLGYGAGEEFGQELSAAADDAQSTGYYDAAGAPLISTITGLTGATGAVVLSDILSSPLKTKKAISNTFGNFFGIRPIISKFTSGIKSSKEKKVGEFFKDIMKSSEPQMTAAKDIENMAVDQTGKKLKLTTAEETMSPGLGQEQASIEAKMAGSELDKIVKRRVDNINTMDEVLSNTVPETDKPFTILIDQRKGTIEPIVKKLDDQISVAEGEMKTITESIKPAGTTKQSGEAIRNEIEIAQFEGATNAVNAINNIPAANQAADVSILKSLQKFTIRDFETGTQPQVVSKINKKINQYLPTEEKIDTVSFNPNTKKIEKVTETTVIPPVKELKNQDLFDIWLSASVEETALIGKAGIENANKLQKLTKLKGEIYKSLQKNLENTEGAPKFFNEVDTYIKKFEEGVILQLRDNKPHGYPVKDEAVADSFFQVNNVEAMQKFINVFGENPNAMANMKDAILDRLANESIDIKTGFINTDKYKRFLTKYDSSLKELAKTDSIFVESLNQTPTAFAAIAERSATLNTRKSFVQGEKLKTTLKIFGGESKQYNFGSTSEYVDAALSNPTLMSNITERAMNAGAGDSWAKAVTEKLTNLRIDPQSGNISSKEINNMKKFLETNKDSLNSLYDSMGKGYEKHFENLKTIIDGFERVSFVTAPKGSPAPTPSEQIKQALGTDTPQIWSRAFAVASNRTGWKFVGMEVFNRFLNTVGVGHFNKVMKEAIYNPEFAKTLTKMKNGGEATVKDIKNVYGIFAKINGTIGSVSENGNTDVTMEDEADAAEQIKEPKADVTEQIKKEVEQGFNVRPDENSRLSNVNIANPVGIRPSPVDPGTSGTDIASINPNTRAKGVEIFGADDAIFGMAQGGIMNTRKQIQRVA